MSQLCAKPAPQPPPDLKVHSISSSASFTLVLAEGGAVYTFGSGPLGHYEPVPRRIAVLDVTRICSITAGGKEVPDRASPHDFCLVSCESGSVYSWGGTEGGHSGGLDLADRARILKT